MKCSAWIRTCVDVFDHPALDTGPYDRRSAWLWLIAKASRLDRRISHKGKPLDLKRGQLLAGRAFLADAWGWSEKQVRLFLDLLAAENMIEKGQSNGHYANVITVCNYDAYQSPTKRQQPVEGPEQGQSRASAGPVQGQTLTENTQVVVGGEGVTREREEAPLPEAKAGETDIGHGVLVNCETIRHRDFSISLKSIHMQLFGTVPMERIRDAAAGQALGWATQIAAGKSPRGVVPDKPENFIRASLQGQANQDAVAEVRKAKAAAMPGVGGGGPRTDYAQAKTERNKAFLDRLRSRKPAEASR